MAIYSLDGIPFDRALEALGESCFIFPEGSLSHWPLAQLYANPVKLKAVMVDSKLFVIESREEAENVIEHVNSLLDSAKTSEGEIIFFMLSITALEEFTERIIPDFVWGDFGEVFLAA